MVVSLDCWVQVGFEQQALVYQQQLIQLGINVQLEYVDKINTKRLNQHPDLLLLVNQHGLSLAANGMSMQPDWIGQLARLKRAHHKNELLARACQTERQPHIIDATAGLGHDGLLLAMLGASVVLVERHPVLFALLKDAHHTASQCAELTGVMQRINLVHDDAAHYLAQQAQQESVVDVVYLDPMFPKGGHKQVKKQAQVKKEMQILHELLPDNGTMDLGEYLLPLARQVGRRVIVKRPRHASTLTTDIPHNQWLGDACRFDGYFQPDLQMKKSLLSQC